MSSAPSPRFLVPVPTRTTVLLAAIAAASSAIAYLVASALRGGGAARYEPTPVIAVIVALAGAAAVGGFALAARGPLPVALLAGLASTVLGFGAAAVFSIGLPFICGGGVILAALFRRASRRTEQLGATAGGSAIGFAISVFLIAALQPPVVRCGTAGAKVADGAEVYPVIRVAQDGRTTTGSFTRGSQRIDFVCRDGQLVQYHLTNLR